MKEKPVILITAGTEVFQKNRKRLFLYEEYALRIRKIGGIPLMIADLDMPEEITALEQLADGLLLSGGGGRGSQVVWRNGYPERRRL